MSGQLSLDFTARRKRVRGMVRHGDPETSVAGAETAIALRRLHRAVLAAFRKSDPLGLTDGELETLEQFAHYGPSTIRKRRHELTLGPSPYLVDSGETRENERGRPMIVWVLTDRGRECEP